jgi:hypothetical protein
MCTNLSVQNTNLYVENANLRVENANLCVENANLNFGGYCTPRFRQNYFNVEINSLMSKI